MAERQFGPGRKSFRMETSTSSDYAAVDFGSLNRNHGARRLFSYLGLLLPILLGGGCAKKAPPPATELTVEVVTVTPKDVPIYKEWIGTLDGYVNAQIRAQVTGYLLTQDYVEGSEVKKGDLLFEIDPRPFQAALDQAKGKLAQDKAQLGKTELDVKRYTPLAQQNAISQQELDDAIQANLAAEASVKADEAAVETANLNLGFTKLIAPIEGIAGVAQSQIGDLVGPGGPVLTTISTINPIKVFFNASEQSYLAYRRQYTNAAVRATHEQELELQLILADGSVYREPGKFFFASREVNQTTGTLLLAGLFPNPENILRPGQFARVRARTETRKDALVVPQRAVAELQGSHQVIVVDKQNKAHIVPVETGDRTGSDWIIEKGLHPGDRVVVEGTQKVVKEGSPVKTQPFTAPQTNSPAASAPGDK